MKNKLLALKIKRNTNKIYRLLINSILLLTIINGNPNKLIFPPLDYDSWNTIYEKNVWVGWADFNGDKICKSTKVYNFSIESIAIKIENKSNYPKIFKRISKVDLFENDVIHITLDMPFPFSNRDYVVKYIQSIEEKAKIYQYYAVEKPKIDLQKNVIRLTNAYGEWRLTQLTPNSTKVSYIWNGELLGSFPDWALTDAWKTQGVEVLNWLEEALIKELY